MTTIKITTEHSAIVCNMYQIKQQNSRSLLNIRKSKMTTFNEICSHTDTLPDIKSLPRQQTFYRKHTFF